MYLCEDASCIFTMQKHAGNGIKYRMRHRCEKRVRIYTADILISRQGKKNAKIISAHAIIEIRTRVRVSFYRFISRYHRANDPEEVVSKN